MQQQVSGSEVMDLDMAKTLQPTSSRILYDIPCKVCKDHSSGKHYGIFACDGCAGFFKRSIRRNRQYVCKARGQETQCLVDKTHRNQCRACRLNKCLEAGMNKDAVQHERGPRNSTLKRQMCLMKSSPRPSQDLIETHPMPFYAAMPYPAINSPLSTEVVRHPLEIQELAAKLLYTNLNWAQGIMPFISLPIKDQTTLLEETLSDLFLLGWAQLLPAVDLTELAGHELRQEAAAFLDAVAVLKSLHLDEQEYFLLKATVLFKTSLEDRSKSLTDVTAVAAFQNYFQVTLGKYMSLKTGGNFGRYSTVLFSLNSLRSISSSEIEELFFRRTIGTTSLVTIISGVYQNKNIELPSLIR